MAKFYRGWAWLRCCQNQTTLNCKWAQFDWIVILKFLTNDFWFTCWLYKMGNIDCKIRTDCPSQVCKHYCWEGNSAHLTKRAVIWEERIHTLKQKDCHWREWIDCLRHIKSTTTTTTNVTVAVKRIQPLRQECSDLGW